MKIFVEVSEETQEHIEEIMQCQNEYESLEEVIAVAVRCLNDEDC